MKSYMMSNYFLYMLICLSYLHGSQAESAYDNVYSADDALARLNGEEVVESLDTNTVNNSISEFLPNASNTLSQENEHTSENNFPDSQNNLNISKTDFVSNGLQNVTEGIGYDSNTVSENVTDIINSISRAHNDDFKPNDQSALDIYGSAVTDVAGSDIESVTITNIVKPLLAASNGSFETVTETTQDESKLIGNAREDVLNSSSDTSEIVLEPNADASKTVDLVNVSKSDNVVSNNSNTISETDNNFLGSVAPVTYQENVGDVLKSMSKSTVNDSEAIAENATETFETIYEVDSNLEPTNQSILLHDSDSTSDVAANDSNSALKTVTTTLKPLFETGNNVNETTTANLQEAPKSAGDVHDAVLNLYNHTLEMVSEPNALKSRNGTNSSNTGTEVGRNASQTNVYNLIESENSGRVFEDVVNALENVFKITSEIVSATDDSNTTNETPEETVLDLTHNISETNQEMSNVSKSAQETLAQILQDAAQTVLNNSDVLGTKPESAFDDSSQTTIETTTDATEIVSENVTNDIYEPVTETIFNSTTAVLEENNSSDTDAGAIISNTQAKSSSNSSETKQAILDAIETITEIMSNASQTYTENTHNNSTTVKNTVNTLNTSEINANISKIPSENDTHIDETTTGTGMNHSTERPETNQVVFDIAPESIDDLQTDTGYFPGTNDTTVFEDEVVGNASTTVVSESENNASIALLNALPQSTITPNKLIPESNIDDLSGNNTLTETAANSGYDFTTAIVPSYTSQINATTYIVGDNIKDKIENISETFKIDTTNDTAHKPEIETTEYVNISTNYDTKEPDLNFFETDEENANLDIKSQNNTQDIKDISDKIDSEPQDIRTDNSLSPMTSSHAEQTRFVHIYMSLISGIAIIFAF